MAGAEPWSHLVSLSELSRGGAIRLEADAPALMRIAGFLEAPAVKSLEADLVASAWLDGARVTGRVRSLVTRTCGITLVEFDEAVDEPLDLRLVPEGSRNAPAPDEGEITIALDADDPPEAVQGGVVDLAARAVEVVDLALSPHPRAPGAEFEAPTMGRDVSPFAALARLRPSIGEG